MLLFVVVVVVVNFIIIIIMGTKQCDTVCWQGSAGLPIVLRDGATDQAMGVGTAAAGSHS